MPHHGWSSLNSYLSGGDCSDGDFFVAGAAGPLNLAITDNGGKLHVRERPPFKDLKDLFNNLPPQLYVA